VFLAIPVYFQDLFAGHHDFVFLSQSYRHFTPLSICSCTEAYSLGVENFVPTRKSKGWRGRTVERPVINCLVFIRATKAEALALIHERGLKADYLFDHATRHLMVVPDKEMEDFQRVFDLSTDEGGLLDRPLELGEKVRVTKGPLQGIEGSIMELQGRHYVVVSLHDFLFARASVPRAWLETKA